jgi:hypothetical protein
MPHRIRFFFAILNLSLFLMAALPIYREFSRRSDIWWTPYGTLVPLVRSADRVEIYARGHRLDGLLEAGQMQLTEAGGSGTLATTDVGLRLNNSDRVRAQGLPQLLLSAAVCGATAVLFVMVVSGSIVWREERS